MLMETNRIVGFLPQFSRFLRVRPIGINKLSTVAAIQSVESKDEKEDGSKQLDFNKFRYHYPEFLPKTIKRNAVREKLERRDMLRRRNVIEIPEFYVGSILSVTTSDRHAPNKMAKFLGICIFRNNDGLNTQFLLRNVIEHQGVEIMFHLYSPVIHRIEVIRLEKRLDDELFYLREAPNEYSTFPMDMLPEYHDKNSPVPVNTIKVPLNPKPWHQKFERMNLKGVILPELREKEIMRALKAQKPWEKYDLMDEYRKIIPEEEQKDLFAEVCDELKKLEAKDKTERKGKVFVKPTKQKLF